MVAVGVLRARELRQERFGRELQELEEELEREDEEDLQDRVDGIIDNRIESCIENAKLPEVVEGWGHVRHPSSLVAHWGIDKMAS